MKRVAVLHMIDHGGASPYHATLARWTDASQFDMHIGSLGPAGALQDSVSAHARTFALDTTRRIVYPAAIAKLVAYITRHDITLLQSHLLESSLVCTAAARLTGRLSVVTTHHSMELSLMPGTKAFWAERLNLRYGTHYISAPAERVRDQLVAIHGLDQRKFAVIPLWFDLERWTVGPTVRPAMRRALHVDETTFVFVAVGRLHWVKNYSLMLHAFRRAFAARPEVRLFIVGDGPDRAALLAEIEALGLSGVVTLLGTRSDVPEILAAADAFLHASNVECFSQVAVEASAAGLPIVSTAVGGMLELVGGAASGELSPPRDESGLAAGMQKMVATPLATRTEMGRRARREAQRYTAEPLVRRHEEQTQAWIERR